jgi:hypothetical protein
MIKTNKGCFISDCDYKDEYTVKYHHSSLNSLYFDGKTPKETFSANWKLIDKYPEKIQKLQSVPDVNLRYEIKDNEMVSAKLPAIIPYEEYSKYDENIICSLYEYQSDKQDSIMIDVECEIDVIMEVENFEMPPVINYNTIKKSLWNDQKIKITNKNINHQLFDRIIFPEIMLHTRPCSISSHNLYCLVRQYIKENIDSKVARITSDYDFCFTVKKLVPLIEPVTVSHSNIFAKKKKDREKISYSTKGFKEIDIFQMTHAQEKYRGYTVIDPIFADSEAQLKEKIDEFLETLIKLINKPLLQCNCCNGTGYLEKINKIATNMKIADTHDK